MPAPHLRFPLVAALAATAVVTLGACAPQDDSPSAASSGTASANACTKDSLATHTKGTFTVGTDKPAYEPWFVDDDPSNGKGFESAVAYAVADKLGFAQPDVKWEVVSFNQATAPGPKAFDVDINQISITDERKKNLDFSSGYYDVAQAVVTVKGSKAENAASIADLKKLKIGAQVGTTSYTAATETIAPDQKVAVYNTNDDAKAALLNGQIDALVVDLPTGLYLAAADLKDGKLVGQIPTTGTPEQFGMVLDKGSALTACVSQAVDALRADGTLDKLEQQWLTSTAGAPVLK
ncbi:ABC transporter substrate-binding protein [Angustibacter sp. McL0619]|uniref:ABC transporter substrate-binding protein n=1 Tax=Angustibacter sp. McL0619 TaxID=3415676 RepID=UPI003CF9A06C